MLIVSIGIIIFIIIHFLIKECFNFERIFDSILGGFLNSLLEFIGGWALKITDYFIAFVLTCVIMNYGLALFKVELDIEHIGNSKVNNEQVQSIDKNSLTTNFENITSELNNLIETFKNSPKEDNDKKFAEVYKKLKQKAIDVRTYTINDITYFYEKEELLKELEKENIEYSDNEEQEEIVLLKYPIYKFGYFEYARGFEINYEYLISQFKPYLSEQWISYLLLMKEQEFDTHTLQPNADDIDTSFCMKWENKLETYLTTYPDFYLKDDIKKEIENYKEALKSIGLE